MEESAIPRSHSRVGLSYLGGVGSRVDQRTGKQSGLRQSFPEGVWGRSGCHNGLSNKEGPPPKDERLETDVINPSGGSPPGLGASLRL